MSIVEQTLNRLNETLKEDARTEPTAYMPFTKAKPRPYFSAPVLVLAVLAGTGLLWFLSQNVAPVTSVTPATKAPALPTAALATPKIELQAAEPALRLLVDQWAKAWARQDVTAYLTFYASNFEVPGGLQRSAWEAQRSLRLTRPRSIKVELEKIQVSMETDSIASVRFVQNFRADAYRETGTHKELRLQLTDGRWRILSERSL